MLLGAFMPVTTVFLLLGFSVTAGRTVRANSPKPLSMFSLLYIVFSVLFIVFSGGDWMEGGRFVVHLLPVAVLLSVVTLRRLLPSRKPFLITCGILLVIQVLSIVDFARTRSTGVPLWRSTDAAGEILRKSSAQPYSWFEKANRVHLRDIPVIHPLDTIVQRLSSQRNNAKVIVMSGQLGMTAYYTAKGNYRSVQLIDRYGLTERSLSGCAMLDNVPRTPLGIGLTQTSFLQNIDSIARGCGIPRPDVIYDVFHRPGELEVLPRSGYIVIYLQKGPVVTGSKLLPGAPVFGGQYIAVRFDLQPSLEDLEFPVFDFRSGETG
jgi:hypothetical protein